MKTFKDLQEADVHPTVKFTPASTETLLQNKKRKPGMTALDDKGKEIPDSIILENGGGSGMTAAIKSTSGVEIFNFDAFVNKLTRITLTKKEISILKRL